MTLIPLPNHDPRSVCVVGMGYVGLTLGLTLSEVGLPVVGVEKRERVVKSLLAGKTYFFEKGLENIFRRELGRRFRFSTEIPQEGADVFIIAVGTPVVGTTPQFEDLQTALQSVGEALKPGNTVLLRSTVPVGTTRSMALPILEKASGLVAGKDFFLAFTPERTIEGRALEELRSLPQVVGGISRECVRKAVELFDTFAPTVVVMPSLEAAEMVKIVNNTFRDVTFAFANEIALICDRWNMDAHEIIQAANLGYTRGQIPSPSPGVGGYCLTKDPHLFAYAAREAGCEPTLILQARKVNEQMPRYVAGQVEKFFRARAASPQGAKVFLLGIAFKGKPETSDIRFSSSLEVAKILRAMGCRVYGYDPRVSWTQIAEEDIIPCHLDEGFWESSAAILMTNHTEFETLPVEDCIDRMTKPALFIDTWRLFPPERIHKIADVAYSNLGFDTIVPPSVSKAFSQPAAERSEGILRQ